MQPSNKVVVGTVIGVLALIGIEMHISATTTAPVATVSGSAPVTVVNTTPVPVTGTVTGQITGQVSINNQPTVNAVQSGTWSVNVGGANMDTANGHLANIQSSVAQLQFDQTGSLYTALRGPIQAATPAISKAFGVSLRLDPNALSDAVPVTVGGTATTINMTMFELLSGHDNVSVYVRGPFLNGSSIIQLPILLNSQTTIVTFPSPIPVSSLAFLCDNAVEHCDFSANLEGY
jgi:hypothetical protein